MSERGDLLELICDASGRLLPLSATVRSWTHIERQGQAMEESRRLGIGGVWPLYAPGRKPLAETEHIEHLLLGPQQNAFRVEHGTPPISTRYGALWLCDGTTTWTQVAPGEFLRQEHLHRPRELPSQAAPLLDPSWLTGYQWDTPVRDTHSGRDVLQMHVRLSADHASMPRVMSSVPADAEVVIDAQLGFLHRLTGLVDGQPYRVIELLDLVLDPEIDEQTFRPDPAQHRVIDDSEWARRLRGPLPLRIWRTLTRPSRVVWHSLTRPFRRRRYPPQR